MSRLAAALAWLGRRGTTAVAASVFLAMLAPPLSELARLLLTPAIFALLTVAFLRVDTAAFGAIARRPGALAAATAWVMLAVPLAAGALLAAAGAFERWPGLALALLLMSCAPPVMSAPAFAALLGLDRSFSLALLIACTALTPLAAPLLARLFAGDALPLSAAGLALRLALLLAGSALAALALRARLGEARIIRSRAELDGVNVILLFVFAVALMDVVARRLLADPMLVVGLAALSFAVAGGLAVATGLALATAGTERALTAGLASGNRNMGLMLAALGSEIPETTWLWFGVAQFPIYLMPALVRPLLPRLSRRGRLPR